MRIYDTTAILRWVPDQIRDGFGCDRLAEIVALDFIAIVVAQEGKLFRNFNALGDDAKIELLPKGNHGSRHGPVAFTAGEIADERLVNFRPGHWEGFQRVETGITCAEIVNGELDTKALQYFHGLYGLIDILHDQAFGNFELEIFGSHSTFAQGIDDAAAITVYDVVKNGLANAINITRKETCQNFRSLMPMSISMT